MISKKRYWGLALPIYECAACGTFEVIGSEDELKERAVEGWDEFEGHSPHRPWIDKVKIACTQLRRDRQSASRMSATRGSMPASWPSRRCNYRHDRDYWEKWYPADLITESFPGQFRNWFYSVLAMSTALTGETAVPERLLLRPDARRERRGDAQEQGQRDLVRRRRRARWASTPCAGSSRRSIRARTSTSASTSPTRSAAGSSCRSGTRTPSSPTMRGSTVSTRPMPATRVHSSERPLLDRWIISRLNQLVANGSHRARSATSPRSAANEIEQFVVEELSNWYIRRNRRRFWKSESRCRQGRRVPHALRVLDHRRRLACAVHPVRDRGDLPEPGSERRRCRA